MEYLWKKIFSLSNKMFLHTYISILGTTPFTGLSYSELTSSSF